MIPQTRIEYYLYVRMKTRKVSLDKDSLILVESPFFVKVLAHLKDGLISIIPFLIFLLSQLILFQQHSNNLHLAPVPHRTVEYDQCLIVFFLIIGKMYLRKRFSYKYLFHYLDRYVVSGSFVRNIHDFIPCNSQKWTNEYPICKRSFNGIPILAFRCSSYKFINTVSA